MLKIDGYLPVFNGVENCALMDYKQTFKQYCCMWGDSKTTFFIWFCVNQKTFPLILMDSTIFLYKEQHYPILMQI